MLDNEKTLRPYQEIGVNFLFNARSGAILADDVGLGKTLTTLTAIKRLQALHGCKAIIICPAFVKVEWESENASVNADIELYSWAKIPSEIEGDFILVGDESHYLQGLTTKRSRRFLSLSRFAFKVFLLSATPMVNGQPINLFNQLKAVSCPVANDLRHYQDKFCDAFLDMRGGRQFLNDRGAKNLDTLRRLMIPYILKRTKEDVAPELPSLSRVHHHGSINSKEMQQSLGNKRKEYRLQADLGEKSLEAIPAVMLQHARRFLSLAKVPVTLDLLRVLKLQGQVVVFTEFVSSATEIAHLLIKENIPTALVTGAVAISDRGRMKKDFQGGKIKVWVATTRSSNVGLNLQCCNQVILHDRAYRIGDVNQAEGRCHRIGSRLPVTSYWVNCHIIDSTIDKYLMTKQNVIDGVLGKGDDIPEQRLLEDLYKLI